MASCLALLFLLLFSSSWGTSLDTTPVPYTPGPLACSCNYSQVWVDVVFLFDASAVGLHVDLDDMWDFVQGMLTNFNVQRADYVGTNYTTRVGIVTYGNKGYVFKPLGSVNNDDLRDIQSLPYNNEPLGNLEDGLYVAASQLSGPNARRNAKHMIVVMATTFIANGVDPPQPTATNFKGNGGTLMVWDYIWNPKKLSGTLQDIASPGYFNSFALNNTADDLMQAFCFASCYCFQYQVPYTVSQQRYPTDGCYSGAGIVTNNQYAKQSCSSRSPTGFLAIVQNAEKNSFLASQMPTGSTYFIGLAFDIISNQWIWPDGSPLGSYAPWIGNSTPPASNNALCVYVNANLEWVPTDCRNGYYYVCEDPPCDSTHYCPVEY